MGKSSKSSVTYPTTTVDTGLFGSSTTSASGSTFKPTDFQKNLVGVTESNAIPALQNYLNPDYESEDYKRGDEYYTNKMQGILQDQYLNPALRNNLLRGSTAQDVYRGFANDLASTEYERQQDYKDQQLQNYMAAMLPYTTIYDISKGTTGLSQALANSIASFELQKNNKSSSGSGLGSILGGAGNFAGGVGSLIGSMNSNGGNTSGVKWAGSNNSIA
jgi:hypothetical protein